MTDVRKLIVVAETYPPAAPALPEVPLYVDDERPDVTSGSKTHAPWRVPDEGAAEWALRKQYEAEEEIRRITAAHAAERARLQAQIAVIDSRVMEITAGQRQRTVFFEAVLLEWMSRCRTAIVKGKTKSRKFLYGTLGWRGAPEVLEYDNEPAALEWAREQGIEAALYRVEVKLKKDAVKRYAKAHDVIPPGAHWKGGTDTPYVKVEAPVAPVIQFPSRQAVEATP
jgi:phage host-nuclease inhibitor protein Gam